MNSRLRELVSALFAGFIGVGLSYAALAAQAEQPVELKQLRGNVYWSPGGGANSGVIVGDKGVVLIDTKISPEAGDELVAEIAKITPKPITNVILTGGGEGVPGLGASKLPAKLDVMSSVATRAAIDERIKTKNRRAPPENRLPNTVFEVPRKMMTINGVRMELLHIAPSHTAGESAVYLPDQKIVFTGYVHQARPEYPIIHPDNGGSAQGWLDFTKILLGLDADTYVIGAGDLWTKADLQKRYDTQLGIQTQVKKMVAEGKSLDEIRKAVGPTFPDGREMPIYVFSEVAYQEIMKAKK